MNGPAAGPIALAVGCRKTTNRKSAPPHAIAITWITRTRSCRCSSRARPTSSSTPHPCPGAVAGQPRRLGATVDPSRVSGRTRVRRARRRLATELERRGADLRDPLWSAKVLVEDPDAIRRVHEAYFEAGADVAISASYQATFEGLAGRGSTAMRPPS